MARKQYNKNNQEEQHKKENITSEPGRHNFTNLARARLIRPAVSPSHPSHRYTLSLAWPPRSQWVVLHVSGLDTSADTDAAQPTARPSVSRRLAKAMSRSSSVNIQQLPIPRPSPGAQWCAQSRRGALKAIADCGVRPCYCRYTATIIMRRVYQPPSCTCLPRSVLPESGKIPNA